MGLILLYFDFSGKRRRKKEKIIIITTTMKTNLYIDSRIYFRPAMQSTFIINARPLSIIYYVYCTYVTYIMYIVLHNRIPGYVVQRVNEQSHTLAQRISFLPLLLVIFGKHNIVYSYMLCNRTMLYRRDRVVPKGINIIFKIQNIWHRVQNFFFKTISGLRPLL